MGLNYRLRLKEGAITFIAGKNHGDSHLRHYMAIYFFKSILGK